MTTRRRNPPTPVDAENLPAERTGQWAGMDAPRCGPYKTRTFRGRVRGEDRWQDIEVTVTFPAWCEVTVYRVVQGTRCSFTETVWWEETYSRAGDRKARQHADPAKPTPASPPADSWRIQRVCAMFLGMHAGPVSQRSRRR
jgi:hypothetical protein